MMITKHQYEEKKDIVINDDQLITKHKYEEQKDMGCSRHGGHPRTGLNSLDALPYIVVIRGLFLVVLYSDFI